MKTKTALPLVIVAMTLPMLCIAERPAGQAPGKAGEIVKDPEAARSQFSGPIITVNREEKTITVNDPKMGAQRLLIADTTKLKRGDKDATWDDLKLGTKVEGVCRGGKEKAEAETISI